MNFLRLPLLRQATAAILVAGLLLQSATAVAPGPAWWDSQTVLDPYALADDFAAANTGQLKYMATKAAAAMEADYPGGAGPDIQTLIASWNAAPAPGVVRDDYLAINQGQLKAVAALFYDRLGQPPPWAGSSGVHDDYQLVNLGQLKHVFSFSLHSRTVGQGATQIPAATLAAALAQWQALPVKPAASSADDFDGDGIPNLQEYLMGAPLFDPLDIDGDRIADSTEDAHPGVLSKLRFADAVEDYDGDGVMNCEELLLGLSLTTATTSGRTDGLSDAEVLAWGLAAGQPLAASTDAVARLWGQIDAAWITANAGSYYLDWLDQTLVNGVPAGLTSFRTDVFTNWIWQPWNPGLWDIQNPPQARDQNGNLVDLDSNGVPDLDRDFDGLPDLWEYRYTLNLRSRLDFNTDPDGDTLSNLQEYQHGTNPRLADSDGDGFSDGAELAQLAQGADPLNGAAGLPLVLQVASSSYQAIYSGQTTPALAVQVTQGGLPVAGVSVVFQVNTGAGRLLPASSTTGTPGSSLSQTTASNGIAAVTYESAAEEPEGTAIITAGQVGASARIFTVSIVAIPTLYVSQGTGGGSDGGTASANPTRVPTPPRSTAASAASTAAATSDGIRIKIKRRLDTDSGYPWADPFPEYLSPYGLSPAALVGWGTFDTRSWGNYTRLDFEALPLPLGPFLKPVVPSGARRYLVLVNQGVDVGSDTSGPPTYVGSLTFHYSDTGARVITLSKGNLPEGFITVQDNESVFIEPPLASGAAGRVWIKLVPFELTLRATGKIEPAPENDSYQMCFIAGQGDDLGPLPMGTGREDYPGGAYTAPLQVIGTVPNLQNTNWRWDRILAYRSWYIYKNQQNNGWIVSVRRPQIGPQLDHTTTKFEDSTPSTNGKVYIYDNSALGIAAGPDTLSPVGIFILEKKQFTYKLETDAGGSWKEAGHLDIGQKIILEKVQRTGVVATDFKGKENSNKIRILDMKITTAEVRAIVGGELPIMIDNNAK